MLWSFTKNARIILLKLSRYRHQPGKFYIRVYTIFSSYNNYLTHCFIQVLYIRPQASKLFANVHSGVVNLKCTVKEKLYITNFITSLLWNICIFRFLASIKNKCFLFVSLFVFLFTYLSVLCVCLFLSWKIMSFVAGVQIQ